MEAALAAFEKRREGILADLMTFLKYPTVSAQPDHAGDVQRCAEWVRDQLAAAGLQVEIVPTDGHPAVLADSGPAEGSGPTLLVYGHYDVQPGGDPDLWDSPAFEPTVRDGRIYARGSADDKGQVMTHIAAARGIREAGERPPVRVKFLIEGEEEIGSPHLPDLLRRHRERLACDHILISDTSKHDHDTPALTGATRGLVYKEIFIDGPARNLHSGQFGGAVANPANVLARIIASLHDEQHRVTIPGFYDDVRPLSDEERRLMAPVELSDADLLALTGSPAPQGEAGFTNNERRTCRPTLDVNGIVGGYIDKGASTIIPAGASAKVSMRLVPDQDPQRISSAFNDAVRRACPPTVRLRIEDSAGCRAYVAPVDSPVMKLARQALADSFGRPAVLIREGGTLPILPLFKEVLGADSILLGFADPDCNAHGPNEFFGIDDFERGTRCLLRFLYVVGRSQP